MFSLHIGGFSLFTIIFLLFLKSTPMFFPFYTTSVLLSFPLLMKQSLFLDVLEYIESNHRAYLLLQDFTCLHLHLHLFHEFFAKFQAEAITMEVVPRFGTNLLGGGRNGGETDEKRRARRERLSGEKEIRNGSSKPIMVG